MRKLIYFVNSSVDGYIDAADGVFDWTEVGPEMSAYSKMLNDRCDSILYGRRVWEMMSSFWPNAESISDHPHDLEYAPVWREMPKIVFSRTLEKADWNTTVIGGDLPEKVTALKNEPGRDLLLMGGSELAGALTACGLIDEYHIAYHRISLGGGKKLFLDHRVELDLTSTRLCDGTVVITTYTRRRP
ncbi:dihydrofolate reductase family protein [Actinocorallia longicatena]|uniref:Dihydrofolate reductase family protein n=1 Tax=Actinocorallia longicatena TaxID=111803 RepID=A0ABP6QGA6_9ACTN